MEVVDILIECRFLFAFIKIVFYCETSEAAHLFVENRDIMIFCSYNNCNDPMPFNNFDMVSPDSHLQDD